MQRKFDGTIHQDNDTIYLVKSSQHPAGKFIDSTGSSSFQIPVCKKDNIFDTNETTNSASSNSVLKENLKVKTQISPMLQNDGNHQMSSLSLMEPYPDKQIHKNYVIPTGKMQTKKEDYANFMSNKICILEVESFDHHMIQNLKFPPKPRSFEIEKERKMAFQTEYVHEKSENEPDCENTHNETKTSRESIHLDSADVACKSKTQTDYEKLPRDGMEIVDISCWPNGLPTNCNGSLFENIPVQGQVSYLQDYDGANEPTHSDFDTNLSAEQNNSCHEYSLKMVKHCQMKVDKTVINVSDHCLQSNNKTSLMHTDKFPNGTEDIKSQHCSRVQVSDSKICNNDGKSLAEGNARYSYLDKIYVCKKCGKKYSKEKSIINHLIVHTDANPFVCSICLKHFCSKKDLNCHIKIHSVEKQFHCDICGKGFNKSSNIVKHKKIHEKDNFACDICQKDFSSNKELVKHLVVHGDKAQFLACSTCGKVFGRQLHLQDHHRLTHTVTASYECQICSQMFTSHHKLKSHLDSHGSRSHTCDICGRKFNHKSSLKYHYRVHLGLKPYKCEFCPEEFRTSSAKNNHEKRHLGMKPHKCDKCEKSFVDLKGLKAHYQCHSKEKLYCCQYCAKSFVDPRSLKRHIDSQHATFRS